MKILDIINQPWAISPQYLEQIATVYSNHLKGEKLDFKALGFGRDKQQRDFEVINNIAIIPVSGPLTPHSSFFSFFFGGTGMDDIKKNIQLAKNDGNKIILHIDSPGGTVAGAFELADFIKEQSKDISIRSFSDGQIASAAMLVSSATDKTFITGKTNQIGSVGVIARKVDFTEENKQSGVNVEEFISGKFKNVGSPDRKTDEFERTAIQNQVDTLFSLFAADISERRDIPVEKIVDMQAKIFIGQEAIDNKLVDGVATLEELLNDSDKGVMIMKLTMESFKAENPELFSEIDQSAYQRGVDAGMITGKTDGATAERARIAGIESSAFTGQDDLKKQLIADGTTTAGDAAIQFNSAQKEVVAAQGTQIEGDAPAPVEHLENQTPDPEPEAKNSVAEYEAAVTKAEDGGKVSRGKAMKMVKNTSPELHAAFIANSNKMGA